jgi:hypothetical protein
LVSNHGKKSYSAVKEGDSRRSLFSFAGNQLEGEEFLKTKKKRNKRGRK